MTIAQARKMNTEILRLKAQARRTGDATYSADAAHLARLVDNAGYIAADPRP